MHGGSSKVRIGRWLRSLPRRGFLRFFHNDVFLRLRDRESDGCREDAGGFCQHHLQRGTLDRWGLSWSSLVARDMTALEPGRRTRLPFFSPRSAQERLLVAG